MNKLLALPVLITLALSSCAAIESARDKLETMPDADYLSLTAKVERGGIKGGVKLGELLGDRTELALSLTRTLMTSIKNDTLDVADIIRGVVDQYGTKLGLEEEHMDYIRDGAKLIDAAVGQIRLGIDGKLTEREKGLILALLNGIQIGLQAQLDAPNVYLRPAPNLPVLWGERNG